MNAEMTHSTPDSLVGVSIAYISMWFNQTFTFGVPPFFKVDRPIIPVTCCDIYVEDEMTHLNTGHICRFTYSLIILLHSISPLS